MQHEDLKEKEADMEIFFKNKVFYKNKIKIKIFLINFVFIYHK